MNVSPTDQIPRLIASREVRARTSLSRATIWRRVRAGEFPPPVRIGSSRIAWRESEVNAWIEAQMPTMAVA